MEIDESEVDFNIDTIDADPRRKIHRYFENARQEVESQYDFYLLNTTKKLDVTDRTEIHQKKDRMLKIINIAEHQCLTCKNERQFNRVSCQLKDSNEKLMKVSNEFFYDDNNYKKGILINPSQFKNKCIDIENRLKNEITEIESQLFQNKSTFFVRNRKQDLITPKQIFGYMISLDYFLQDNEMHVLKKELETTVDIKNSKNLSNFQLYKKNDLSYSFQHNQNSEFNVLNRKIINLLKLYENILEKMIREREDFIHFNEKQIKKILSNDELYLQYDHSELNYIEPNTFVQFKRLICLDLFMNNLTIVETDTFKGLTSLECLILNNNTINCIQPDSFRNLSNLTDLYLDGNNLTKLNKNIFDGLGFLQKLSLSNNQIDRVENFGKFGGSGLENLIYLNLNENKITKIESNSFKGLVNLNSLYLIGNKIQAIKKYAFLGLDKLNKLSLCNNLIENVEPNAFEGLSNLDFLNLKNNKLAFLNANLFEKLINLRNLNLSYNKFDSCRNFSFRGLRKGILLNLSNNHIDSDKKEMDLFEKQSEEFKVFLIR